MKSESTTPRFVWSKDSVILKVDGKSGKFVNGQFVPNNTPNKTK